MSETVGVPVAERPRPFGLTAFGLKVIALTLMLTEHLGRYLPDTMPPGWPLAFVYAGRVVFPIFLFLVIEGCFHTRSTVRFLTRLWTAAAVMAVGNLAVELLVSAVYDPVELVPVDQNIFLTLALAASAVVVFERARFDTRLREIQQAAFVALGAGLLGAMLFTEGSIIGIALTLVFYLLRDRRGPMLAAFAAVSLLLGALLWVADPAVFWTEGYQWAMLLSVPLLVLYNGRRGPTGPVSKWMFYVLYPAHIWALYLAAYATGAR